MKYFAAFAFFLVGFIPGSHAYEGFYPVDSVPPSYLRALNLDKRTVDYASHRVANLGQIAQRRFADNAALEAAKSSVRKWNAGYRKWFFDYVEAVNSVSDCSRGCSVEFYQNVCSAVFVKANDKTYLASAKHCLWLLNPNTPTGERKNIYSRFVDPSTGKMRTIPLVDTVDLITNHYLPFEGILFKVDPSERVPTLPLATSLPEKGDPVFGVGIPSTDGRSKVDPRVPPYPVKDYFDTRVTFGRVVYANRGRLAYCGFSNNIEVAKPHTWRPQSSCDHFDYGKLHYPSREERNFLLADTDMTYGMSGSPLFNSRGEVVGIGNSILDDQAENYVPGGYAIYSKAENLNVLFSRDSAPAGRSDALSSNVKERARISRSAKFFRASRHRNR